MSLGSIDKITEILFTTFKSIKDNSPSVPVNMLQNHDMKYLGEKHTFGSSPKNIYQGNNLTVYTEDEVLPISNRVQYESITGVYKR